MIRRSVSGGVAEKHVSDRFHRFPHLFVPRPTVHIHRHIRRGMPRQFLRRFDVRPGIEDEIDIRRAQRMESASANGRDWFLSGGVGTARMPILISRSRCSSISLYLWCFHSWLSFPFVGIITPGLSLSTMVFPPLCSLGLLAIRFLGFPPAELAVADFPFRYVFAYFAHGMASSLFRPVRDSARQEIGNYQNRDSAFQSPIRKWGAFPCRAVFNRARRGGRDAAEVLSFLLCRSCGLRQSR